MALGFTLPQGIVQGLARPQAQQPAEPFVWGQGGRRMTPEQIERDRRIASALMQQGGDTSPVGHWSQGLARVAQGLLGGYQQADARKAEGANAAESSAAMRALMQPDADPSALAGAVGNQYLDPMTREFAGAMAAQRMRPPELTDEQKMLVAMGIDPSSEQGRGMLHDQWTDRINKPVPVTRPDGTITAVLPSQLRAMAAAEAATEVFDTLPDGFTVVPPGGPTQPASANFPAGRR